MKILKLTKKAEQYQKIETIENTMETTIKKLTRELENAYYDFLKIDNFETECSNCGSILSYSINDINIYYSSWHKINCPCCKGIITNYKNFNIEDLKWDYVFEMYYNRKYFKVETAGFFITLFEKYIDESCPIIIQLRTDIKNHQESIKEILKK